jgi:hypothetical protein
MAVTWMSKCPRDIWVEELVMYSPGEVTEYKLYWECPSAPGIYERRSWLCTLQVRSQSTNCIENVQVYSRDIWAEDLAMYSPGEVTEYKLYWECQVYSRDIWAEELAMYSPGKVTEYILYWECQVYSKGYMSGEAGYVLSRWGHRVQIVLRISSVLQGIYERRSWLCTLQVRSQSTNCIENAKNSVYCELLTPGVESRWNQ